MTYGVIDVGSNTIRLCIYEVEDGRIKSLFNNKTTAGLIGYVDGGELTRKGIKKACDVLSAYKEMASHAKIKELFVFATASLRNISNTDEAIETIYEETGLKVDVLTGYEEATLDFKGAAHTMHLGEGIMVAAARRSWFMIMEISRMLPVCVLAPFPYIKIMYRNFSRKKARKRQFGKRSFQN